VESWGQITASFAATRWIAFKVAFFICLGRSTTYFGDTISARREQAMNRIFSFAAALAVTIVLLITLYFGFRLSAALGQGYTWKEMDWSQKGSTSLADVLKASEIGRRKVTKEAKMCLEYYSYKDGLSVKIDCSGK
jgi:hypothetical protein